MGKIFSFSKYAPPFPSTPWAKYSPSLNILLLLLLLSSNIFLRQFCFHGSDEEKTPRCIDERKLWLQISIPATAFHRLPSWGQAISPSAQSARWLPRALARTARWRPPTRRRRARASPTGQRLPQDPNRVRSGRSSTSTFSLDLFTISSAGICYSLYLFVQFMYHAMFIIFDIVNVLLAKLKRCIRLLKMICSKGSDKPFKKNAKKSTLGTFLSPDGINEWFTCQK